MNDKTTTELDRIERQIDIDARRSGSGTWSPGQAGTSTPARS